ncbi:MAG: hypothetical protein M0R46_13415 [Candidatus Muirbacterium halophilum]|nr:hypothetical protein [Candidatus Muirbacterium halophilum]MCK9476920.1 hypothetical protein [Candidatus Muirbacterium halophilum]
MFIKLNSNILIKDFFNLVEGDFACIIKTSCKTLLYRTFPGAVPLYFKKAGNSFYISDKFSYFPDLKINSKDIVNKIFSIKEISPHLTVFKNINRLIPEEIVDLFNNKKILKPYITNKYNDISLKYLIEKNINKRKFQNNSIFLSEGTDSNVIWQICSDIKPYSLVFDEKCENIINKRTKGKDRFVYFPFKEKFKFNKKNYKSIDYIFNPNTEIFRPLLKKMVDENINTVFYGIGGDEIQGRDQTFNLLKDYFYRGNLNILWKKRRFLKNMFELCDFNTYKGSFFKGGILNYLKSSIFLFNLEMIYNILSEYNLFPAYPLLDKSVVSWFLNKKYNDILEFGKDSKKLKKHLYNITQDAGLKITFNSFLKELFNIKFENNSFKLYNKNISTMSYKIWRNNVRKKKYKKISL